MECDNQSCQLLPNHPSCLFVLRFSDNQEFYLWRSTNHRMFCCCSKVSCISSAFQCSSQCKRSTMASSYLLCMHLVHLEPKEMCILIKGGNVMSYNTYSPFARSLLWIWWRHLFSELFQKCLVSAFLDP